MEGRRKGEREGEKKSRPHQHLLVGSLMGRWVMWAVLLRGIIRIRIYVCMLGWLWGCGDTAWFSFLGRRLHFLGRRVGAVKSGLLIGMERYLSTSQCLFIMPKVKPLSRLMSKKWEGFRNRRLNWTETCWVFSPPRTEHGLEFDL